MRKVICRKASANCVQAKCPAALKELSAKVEVELSVSMYPPTEAKCLDDSPAKGNLIKVIESERMLFYMSRGIKLD